MFSTELFELYQTIASLIKSYLGIYENLQSVNPTLNT